MQGRHGKSDFPHMHKYSCSRCQIDYHMREGLKAQCPLCEERDKAIALQTQLDTLANQMRLLEQDHARIRVQVSLLDGMREALSVTSELDMMYIKAFIYEWRANRATVSIRPNDRRQGFYVHRRGQSDEYYQCNSVGGVMLSTCLHEAVRLGGYTKATELLVRALSGRLTEAPEPS